jgi:hypothetical protein
MSHTRGTQVEAKGVTDRACKVAIGRGHWRVQRCTLSLGRSSEGGGALGAFSHCSEQP